LKVLNHRKLYGVNCEKDNIRKNMACCEGWFLELAHFIINGNQDAKNTYYLFVNKFSI